MLPDPTNPTPDMLAGLSVRVEAAEDFAVRPYQPPQPPASTATNGAEHPTVDQLAGVYLLAEAPEDLTVHPRETPVSGQGP
jgi:hypothetical protein